MNALLMFLILSHFIQWWGLIGCLVVDIIVNPEQPISRLRIILTLLGVYPYYLVVVKFINSDWI